QRVLNDPRAKRRRLAQAVQQAAGGMTGSTTKAHPQQQLPVTRKASTRKKRDGGDRNHPAAFSFSPRHRDQMVFLRPAVFYGYYFQTVRSFLHSCTDHTGVGIIIK